jgi:hypothetical protein
MTILANALGIAVPQGQSFGAMIAQWVVADLTKFAQDMRDLADAINQVSLWFKGVSLDSSKFFTDLAAGIITIQNFWNSMWNSAAMDAIKSAMQSIGSAITNFLMQPIRDVTTAWNALMGLFGRRPPAIQAPTVTAAPALPAPPPTAEAMAPAYQLGGIIGRATRALVGERGPEAIIPLSGGRRATGLLDYASKAMGFGGVAAAGPTSVSFAPNIVINGSASEAEQRAMDSRLRDLARDFISQFKAAQQQERRLSYESGYG